MNNRKILIILLIAFALMLVAASYLYSQLSQTQSPDQLSVQQEAPLPEPQKSEVPPAQEEETLHKAPDFTAYDESGNEVRLSDFFGKPIVLNFWASWCGPCRMEMPDFQEKYLELGDEINFIMVNITGGRETLASAKSFIAEQGYTFPVFYDTSSDAAITYGANSLPTTYFIDAAGNAIAQATGAIDGETLVRGIEMIK